jgi:DNA-binding LacI/PurR family transcriptional regulator
MPDAPVKNRRRRRPGLRRRPPGGPTRQRAGEVTPTLAPDMPRVTLQTIADRLGVSRMTVSNAFSRPDQLSSALRQRILATADKLGYVGPDPAGRALARGTTGAVGVLLTDSLPYAFSDDVATRFLGAIADELAPTGLALTLLTSSDRTDGVVPPRDIAIDGALVYSCRKESAARDWLMRRRLPIVFVDQDAEPRIPASTSTTGVAPGPPPSTSSTSVTAGWDS